MLLTPAAAAAAAAAVTIRGGRIVSVSDQVPTSSRYPITYYGSAVISPGVIDVHVHMNEPGREDWEGEQCHLPVTWVGEGVERIRRGRAHFHPRCSLLMGNATVVLKMSH
jgi:predicted amidohydrolase YtcJ